MFYYEKLFEPFTGNGATLEKSIKWLKKTAKINDRIADQVVSDTMHLLSQGAKFELPCPCGCELDHVNIPIEHFMLARAIEIKKKADAAYLKVIEENEKRRLEGRMALLVSRDKQMFEAYHGTWTQRNLPTFRRWLGLKD